MEMLSDAELIAATINDINAYSAIIERYRPLLLRYIKRLGTHDPHTAEDILQDVFISVYRNLYSYNNELPFSSWIYRITHNKTISSFRTHKRTATISLEEYDYALLPSEQQQDNPKIDSSDKNLITKTLEKMPEHYREVLILYYLEEKSYDEIADILKKPPGTIATLLHRSKKIFSTLFKEYYHE